MLFRGCLAEGSRGCLHELPPYLQVEAVRRSSSPVAPPVGRPHSRPSGTLGGCVCIKASVRSSRGSRTAACGRTQHSPCTAATGGARERPGPVQQLRCVRLAGDGRGLRPHNSGRQSRFGELGRFSPSSSGTAQQRRGGSESSSLSAGLLPQLPTTSLDHLIVRGLDQCHFYKYLKYSVCISQNVHGVGRKETIHKYVSLPPTSDCFPRSAIFSYT